MRFLLAVTVLLGVAGCRCGPQVSQIKPTLGVAPNGLDFGQVKVGDAKQLTVKLSSQTRTSVTFSSITIEGPAAAAFRLGSTPMEIGPEASETLRITFTPPAEAAFIATLTINSSDPERGVVKVALAGEGAEPKFVVTPDCPQSRACVGTVVLEPPSIDFGMRPASAAVPLDSTKVPAVVVVNEGDVSLHVDSLSFGGADATAFGLHPSITFPDGGVTLGAQEGFNLPLRFLPTSEAQNAYAGTVTLTSDDPHNPSVTIALQGTLKPNEAPSICANLIRVVPQSVTENPRDYGTASEWMTLTNPPVGGVDLSLRRDVRPGDLVVLSATSDSSDVTKCSSDPEDGRMGLTYLWRVTRDPTGPVAIPLGATEQVQFRATRTGSYTVELTIADSRGSMKTTSLQFIASVKQDLVVQLEWPGFSGADLDLHLVRPTSVTGNDAFTGAFSYFNAGPANRTSGDINGYANTIRGANAGFDFDWGGAGSLDDPRLNLDDRGDGQLIENISMNYPENDATCDAGCTYPVLVHYFEDNRMPMSPPACVVDGTPNCGDGERCACTTEQRCVADAPADGGAPFGSGKCFVAPAPTVKIYFYGSATPAATVPMPPTEVLLGSPCTLWHVADIDWPGRALQGSLPDGGTPPPVIRASGSSFAKFGRRAVGGSLACSPNVTQGAVNWYGRE